MPARGARFLANQSHRRLSAATAATVRRLRQQARPGHGSRVKPARSEVRCVCARRLLAVGHQDVDPAGVTPPSGLVLLGASSDHLVLDADASDVAVGDSIELGLDYSALVRAMTSPFVAKVLKGDPRPSPSS